MANKGVFTLLYARACFNVQRYEEFLKLTTAFLFFILINAKKVKKRAFGGQFFPARFLSLFTTNFRVRKKELKSIDFQLLSFGRDYWTRIGEHFRRSLKPL